MARGPHGLPFISLEQCKECSRQAAPDLGTLDPLAGQLLQQFALLKLPQEGLKLCRAAAISRERAADEAGGDEDGGA